MPARTFTDRSGVRWTVWEVIPGRHNPVSGRSSTLPVEMSGGWLCFDSGAEKRRLYPIPPGWEDFPDEKMELLCRAGLPVSRRPEAAAPEPAPAG
jgi:hypothetical protein